MTSPSPPQSGDDEFSKRINELESQITNLQGKTAFKEKCIPTIIVLLVLTPIFIGLGLYFIKPKMVLTKKGSKYIRDKWKMWTRTALLTAIVWALLYGFAYYKGYNCFSVLCVGSSCANKGRAVP